MSRAFQRRYTAVLGALTWIAAASLSAAAPLDDAARAKARALGYAGVEAYAEGDYRGATAKLEESYQLLPVPSLGLWSARALAKLGKLVEAEERYRAVANLPMKPEDPPAQHAAKADASREHGQLLPRIPSLKIRFVGASPAEIQVTVDGVARSNSELDLALLLNPGRHTVAGTRGEERSEVILSLGEAAHEEVELRFSGRPLVTAAPQKEAPSAAALTANAELEEQLAERRLWRTGAWIAVGAGVAGLATSWVAYLMADNQFESFQERDSCANGSCSQEEVDTYETLRTLHLVSFITGSVLTAAGTTVLVVTWGSPEDAPDSSPRVSLRLGPGHAALSGSF